VEGGHCKRIVTTKENFAPLLASAGAKGIPLGQTLCLSGKEKGLSYF